MKTLTEIDGFTLNRAILLKKELLAAGKTAEELPQALGEALKREGDKLNFLLTALEISEGKLNHLKRVLVMTVGEGEKAPQGAVQKEDKYFVSEYFYVPAPKNERKGGGRDFKGKGGGRGGKRGGRDNKGKGGGENRGDRKPAGGGRGRPFDKNKDNSLQIVVKNADGTVQTTQEGAPKNPGDRPRRPARAPRPPRPPRVPTPHNGVKIDLKSLPPLPPKKPKPASEAVEQSAAVDATPTPESSSSGTAQE